MACGDTQCAWFAHLIAIQRLLMLLVHMRTVVIAPMVSAFGSMLRKVRSRYGDKVDALFDHICG